MRGLRIREAPVKGSRPPMRTDQMNVVVRSALVLLLAVSISRSAPADAPFRPLSREVGHRRTIGALAVCPKAPVLASGGWDHQVLLWDLVERKVARRLTGHADWVSALAWSPDGAWLASGSRDGTTRLWDRASGRTLQVLKGHPNGVTAIAFAPDGRQIATVGFDGALRLWNPTTGVETHSVRISTGALRQVGYNASGDSLAVGGDNGLVQIVATGTSRLGRSFRGATKSVTLVAFLPDGESLIALGRDHVLRRWRIMTGELLEATDGMVGGVLEGSFSDVASLWRDAGYLATSSGMGISVWSLKRRAFVYEMMTPLPEDAYAITFASPDRIFAGTASGEIYIVDLVIGAP